MVPNEQLPDFSLELYFGNKDLCTKERFYRIIYRFPDERDMRYEDNFTSYRDYIHRVKKICNTDNA